MLFCRKVDEVSILLGRINEVKRMSVNINKWGWRVDEKGWINYKRC
jgi:hypothetical protein